MVTKAEKRKLPKIMIGLVFCLFCILPGCGKAAQTSQETVLEENVGSVKLASGAYDSGDTAVLVAKDEKKNQLTFFNLVRKKKYTLDYDGTTRFFDKYGSAISVSQLALGEMVDVNFLKESKELVQASLSTGILSLDGVSKFDLDQNSNSIKIQDDTYSITDDTIVISGGQQVELMDINAQDVLKVRGYDHEIYSIIVEKGHGYLRLTNDEYFIGGWIEVGQKLIQRIEEDMLLVVPEGSYEVFLSNDGIEGSKQVTIARDQEVELDVSDLRTEDLVKYGNLIFTLSPETASVYLDGVEVDTTRTVKTEYGLHQIMAKADGYETVIQYIKVSQESANVSITLDEEKDRTVSGNSTTSTVSDNSTTTSTGNSTGYKVTLESPTGAEAYVDGNYVGVIPVSFSKTSGSHVISIRKTGYVTRSYTIDVDDEEKDISFSFSDLTAEE